MDDKLVSQVSISELKDILDEALIKFLPTSKSEYTKKCIDAMRYSFCAGGKRLRPMLLLAAYDMCIPKEVYENQSIYGAVFNVGPFMAALEMIHSYSLIHDDLPAMDNDDVRRGKPTCHIKFGEDCAILAGDALLNYAYEILFKHIYSKMGTNAENVARCIKASYYLAKSAGIYGMVAGQVSDMYFTENSITTEKELEFIDENKTAALIKAALVVGGIIAGAPEEQIKRLEQIGHNIGIAFQIQDDILDKVGDANKFGKPIGSDEKNNKSTYVSILGIDECQKRVDNLINESISLTKLFRGNKTLLINLIEYLRNRTF